ncbi:MAG TPA: hypothetical protein PK201_02950 [Accumulibacter sp.]|nr:hypothetical protein [Accumulibacter sp.]
MKTTRPGEQKNPAIAGVSTIGGLVQVPGRARLPSIRRPLICAAPRTSAWLELTAGLARRGRQRPVADGSGRPRG